ncbi:MFS transporter [Streptomyces sp. Vc74B-19]|uniref:MFS transporter n=1 Tax=unclassified Streptomyces TaxID=2593676 RepID=UPI001BFC1291|nr:MULTISPECIES: MFS transporter [unclassified Streptomyces]MBT3164735.1 MFS transporter [Streptomyces sp. Vc74B-19]
MERSLLGARVATYVYFVLCGTLMGAWVVHIPAVEERVGISHATLGGLLVLLGLGAFAGMQVAGPLTDRLGARVVVPATAVLCGASLVLPGLAHDPWTLAGALLVFGACNGGLDVSMNAHAVHVEKAYGRPVMSGFHATFSVGGVVAALVAAGATSAGVSPAATMGAIGAVSIVIALVSVRALMPAAPATEKTGSEEKTHASPAVEGPGAGRRGRSAGRRVWLLAVLALMVMLCEGAANDWSALHLRDVLGASTSTAAFAYGTFAAAMTIGRLLADGVVSRFGSMAVLRHGAITAAVGITLVALGPWMWTAFAGWALFGLGLSGTVPQLFSAAGHVAPEAAGANVSRVAGLGYVGMLAGPAVIGWLTHVVALNHTFILLTLLCVTTAVGAGVLRTTSDAVPRSETAGVGH